MTSDGAKDAIDAEKVVNVEAEPKTEVEHRDDPSSSNSKDEGLDEGARQRFEASQKLANPLAGLGLDQLSGLGEEYAKKAGFTDESDVRAFRLGAVLAGNGGNHQEIAELTETEREFLDRETTHKWSNPSKLYYVIISM